MQPTVSTSTFEAEYLAQAETACEVVWIRGLLKELPILPENASPTTILADNQGAIKLAENPEYHRKTKHIPIKYHKVWEFIANKTISLFWVPTNKMLADGLTRWLWITKFCAFVAVLGLIEHPP